MLFRSVDTTAGVSKQIDLATFRNTAFHQNVIYGAANQGLALVPATVVYLSGFAASAGEGGADEVAGTITIDVEGIARFEGFVKFNITSPSALDNFWKLIVKVDDGVSPVFYNVDQLFTTDAAVTSVIFNAHRIIPVNAGDIISFGISTTALTTAIDVIDSSFKTEIV